MWVRSPPGREWSTGIGTRLSPKRMWVRSSPGREWSSGIGVSPKGSWLRSQLVSWSDDRLTWNTSDNSDISTIRLKGEDIWVPLVLLNNAADGIKVISDNADTASVRLTISNTGEVHWLAPVEFNAQCTVNIAYYPFDQQSCSVIISTWMFDIDELMLMTDDSGINFDMYEANGEWDVVSSSSSNATRTFLGHAMSAVQYDITIQRKYQFYLLNIIFPIILLALLGPFVFLLPIDSGEKNGFTLTVMLSMSVMMSYISDHIPTTASDVCILSEYMGVFLLVTFIINSIETFLTVIVWRIHDTHKYGHIPSKGTQTALRVLAKITAYRRAEEVEHQSEGKKTPIVAPNDTEGTQDRAKTPTAWEDGSNIDDYTYEEFALLLDRFNFVFFLFLTCLVTLVILIILTTG
ncbi:neuronal acetylcholine receptor subunit alpha-2-like [Mya arenaria]|uniref:neuronal acetylcholine receptor subunit alpha-2-like n=1 Tax=Mya arenaria TaxID=6604 RepID=UPI0022E64526|nr:neuronal acetylcholine receptor subunit alpha-2-like [Mya arenaria]